MTAVDEARPDVGLGDILSEFLAPVADAIVSNSQVDWDEDDWL